MREREREDRTQDTKCKSSESSFTEMLVKTENSLRAHEHEHFTPLQLSEGTSPHEFPGEIIHSRLSVDKESINTFLP